jgi:hypothetical protein
MHRTIAGVAAIVLATALFSACGEKLPDYGLTYRIDDAALAAGGVEVTYTVANAGDRDLSDLELQLSVVADDGVQFTVLTEKRSLSTETTQTRKTVVEITGGFTPKYLTGTTTLENVFVSGVWWDE